MNTKKIDFVIRMARLPDAEQLLEIYRPYVEDTAISFEWEVPSVEEFRERIRNTMEMYPYYVAVDGERILGYAYVSPFKARKAYDWAVETTIYIRQECRGMGCGKALYLALEEMLRRQNIINMNACIAYTDYEDEHLTNKSMEFHEHMGYRLVGTFHKCGYKFGKWYDMIWMEKMIQEHPEHAEPVIPVGKVKKTTF